MNAIAYAFGLFMIAPILTPPCIAALAAPNWKWLVGVDAVIGAALVYVASRPRIAPCGFSSNPMNIPESGEWATAALVALTIGTALRAVQLTTQPGRNSIALRVFVACLAYLALPFCFRIWGAFQYWTGLRFCVDPG